MKRIGKKADDRLVRDRASGKNGIEFVNQLITFLMPEYAKISVKL